MSLSVLAWDHPRATAPLAACSDLWERRGGGPLTITTRSLRSFGDDVPWAGDSDLVLIDHPHVGQAAAEGAIVALDGLLDERQLARLATDSAGASHASYEHAGHHWAVAIDAACQALAMSRCALEEGPPPATWDEVLALAQARPGRVALPLQPAHAICALLSLIATREQIADGSELATTATLQWAASVLATLAVTGPDNAFEWEPPEALERLEAGELSCIPLVFAYVGYDVVWASAPTLAPAGRPGSILGGVGAAVLSDSADPKAAAELAAWLGSSEIQRGLVLGSGGQPATHSAWSAPGADPMFGAVLPTLEVAQIRPRAQWWPAFQRASGELLVEHLRDRAEPARIAKELARLYQDYRYETR